MASKDKVVFNAEKGEWEIKRTDSKGNTRTQDSIANVEHLSLSDSVSIFAGFVKEQKKLRDASLSLLADIMTYGKGTMDGYKGTADPKKAMPNQLKDTFRDLESAFFKQFLQAEHELHESFVKRLPKQDERGNEFLVLGKPNQEAQFQYFLTVLRKAPSYANAKNVFLSFWAYCGQSPLASDGSIVPPEAMRIMVAQVQDVQGPDNSIKGRLYDLRREWVVEEKNPRAEDLPEIISTLQELLSHAQTKARVQAELADGQAARARSIKEAADKAITTAQETLQGVGVKPAPETTT